MVTQMKIQAGMLTVLASHADSSEACHTFHPTALVTTAPVSRRGEGREENVYVAIGFKFVHISDSVK